MLKFFFILFPYCALAAEAPLTLETYLNSVVEKHEGIQANRLNSDGAQMRARSGFVKTAPTFFVEASHREDRRPTIAPAFQGTKTTNNNLSLGVSKLFPFGLQTKLYHVVTTTEITGADPNLVRNPMFIDTSPVLELSFSLLRNGFGSQVQAGRELREAEALSKRFTESFTEKRTRAEAEGTYWRLVVAKQVAAVQKENLGGALKLKEWSGRRASLDLADKSDLLQAEAALAVRKLDHAQALNEVRAASRAFNLFRSVDSDEVSESLEALPEATVGQLQPPPFKTNRDDVKAAEQLARMARAKSQLDLEDTRASLDLFTNASLNGRASALNNSLDQTYGARYPLWTIGLKFETPLSFGLTSDVHEGFQQEKRAAELQYARKLKEQESEWKDLSRKLEEAKERFALYQSIEKAQKIKTENENRRLKSGKSIFFQVLQFEAELAQAQVGLLRAMQEILAVNAQLKLFKEDTNDAGRTVD